MDSPETEAIDAELSRKKRIVQTVFISGIYLIFGVVRSQEGVAFLDLVETTNSDISNGSLMFTWSAFGYMIGVLFIGVLYDKVNNDILYCACVMMAGLLTVLIPWCTSLPLMTALFALRSLFAGPSDSGSSVICAKTWLMRSGPFLQNLQFLFAVGGILAPFLTEPFLVERGNSSLSSYAAENLSISTVISESYLTHWNNSDSVLYSVYNNNTINMSGSVSTRRLEPAETTRVYIAFAISGGLLLCCCAGFALKIAFYSSGDFDRFEKSAEKKKANVIRPDPVDNFPFSVKLFCYVLLAVFHFAMGSVEKILMSFLMTFTVKYLGWNTMEGSLANSVFWAGFAGGRFAAIFLTNCLKDRTLLFADLMGLLCTFVSMFILDQFSAGPGAWWFLIGSSGLFLSSIFATSVTWLAINMTTITGRVMAYIYVWLFSGTMANMFLLGYLFEDYTPRWFVYLLIIFTSLGLISMTFLVVVTRRFAEPLSQLNSSLHGCQSVLVEASPVPSEVDKK